jgi:hypothetical protein
MWILRGILAAQNILKVRACRPLRQFHVHRANIVYRGLLQVRDHLITPFPKGGIGNHLTELVPIVVAILIKLPPKFNWSLTPADLRHRAILSIEDTE